VAVEAAYIDFGAASGRFTGTGSNGNYQVTMSGFAPYVVGILPLGPVELSAKVGSYFYDVKVRANFDNPNPGVDSSHSRNDFLYGVGLGFTVFNHIHLRAEYETIELKNASNTDAYWLSGAWRF
jgi:opacity protein-like surface antigen